MNSKIVIDSDIPFIEGVFEPYFSEVLYLKGMDICAENLSDADALVTRTRTKCTGELLKGSAVKAIATATIGLDHIDDTFCKEQGIEVFSAQGCNARAVMQWVFSSIEVLQLRGLVSKDFTLGIVGVGNVGCEVEGVAKEKGIKTLLCDPPRQQREGSCDFVSLDELLAQSDVVTTHVSLDSTTRGMINDDFLKKMQKGAVLLNASRGEVHLEEDLLLCDSVVYALDVWCSEPNINRELLAKAAIATPHIAGYSMRGKARATIMCVQQLAEFFSIEELKNWGEHLDFPLEETLGCDVLHYDNLLRKSPEDFENQRTFR
ncbi:MAG: 4-phosphoerythronate dehydrogenase [Rikenellaceae bacterium]